MRKTSESVFKISQVINLTGVSEFVLRAWENRYQALTPARTKTGRRLYTREDVLKTRLLFELTERNHKIREIAQLSLRQLQNIAQITRQSPESVRIDYSFSQVLLQKIQAQDWNGIQLQLLKKREEMPVRFFIHEIILPLLKKISTQVEEKKISIVQEHILSALIKENLYALKNKSPTSMNNCRMVIAGQEKDYHEIGLLISLVLASHSGIKTLYLGANVPNRDLCEACIQFKASHLLFSSTLSKKEGAKQDLLESINFIHEHLPKKTALWIAGRNTKNLRLDIKRDYQLVSTFEYFEKLLKNSHKSTSLS